MRKGLSCLLISMVLGIMAGWCLAGEIGEEIDEILNELETKGKKLSEVEKKTVKEKCIEIMNTMDECASVYRAKYSCISASERMFDVATKVFSMEGVEKVKVEKVASMWSELCEGACMHPVGYSVDREGAVLVLCVGTVLGLYGK